MKGSALLPVILGAAFPLLLFGLIIVGLNTEIVAWRPPLLWASYFGTAAAYSQGSGVTAMAATNSGVYVGGDLNCCLAGSAFLSSYDSSGRAVWTRTVSSNLSSAFPGFPTERPVSGIAFWSNSIFVSANVNASSIVVAYDASGNRSWIAKMGGLYSEIDGVAANPTGVYVTGYISSVNLVQKYDTSGRLIWNTTFKQSEDYPVGLSAGSSGVYVQTTESLINFDQNGNMVWTQPVNCGGCVDGQSISESMGDLYIANKFGASKYATDGSVAWNANFTLPSQYASIGSVSISADQSGAYLLIEPYAERNGFLLRYDPSGKEAWSYKLPAQGDYYGRNTPYLAVDNGNLYLGGHSTSNVYGLVEGYSEVESLVFFGINPPWSFVTLGGVVGPILFGSIFSIRRFLRKGRPRHRTKRVRGIPSD